VFAGDARLEIALARAEARLKIIPKGAAEAIASAARAETFDGSALSEAALRAGSQPFRW